MHDPRGKYNVGIGYAISEIGAEHLVVPHDPALANPDSISFKNSLALGIESAQPVRSFGSEKMRHFYILEQLTSLEKVIGYCYFGPAPRSYIHPDDVLLSINAASGWKLSMEEALMIGERATNLARVFNAREGFSREDDTLPERLFQGLENGALHGEITVNSNEIVYVTGTSNFLHQVGNKIRRPALHQVGAEMGAALTV